MKNSSQIVISAPMSFSGSSRRIQNWMPAGHAWLAWATLLVPLAWMLILIWYMVFGLLLVPYRLIRRGGRKRKLADARHAELLNRSR